MIISIILMLILHLTTPFWWWIMVVPFLYGLIRSRSALHAFSTGLGSAGLLWLGASIYLYNTGSALIAEKIAVMMTLPSPLLIIVITTAIAMIAGGFSCCAGYLCYSAFQDLKDQDNA